MPPSPFFPSAAVSITACTMLPASTAEISRCHFCPNVATYPCRRRCLCLSFSRTIVPALSISVAPLHQRQPHQRSAPSPLICSLTPRPSATAASPCFPLLSVALFFATDSRRGWLPMPPPAVAGCRCFPQLLTTGPRRHHNARRTSSLRSFFSPASARQGLYLVGLIHIFPLQRCHRCPPLSLLSPLPSAAYAAAPSFSAALPRIATLPLLPPSSAPANVVPSIAASPAYRCPLLPLTAIAVVVPPILTVGINNNRRSHRCCSSLPSPP
ncbi:hypothetical protein BHE74_00056788 [Ensete ventricosum]|nr:hypothetical protein BHE74_00056788 [Ensete ventricosum]